MVGTTLLSTSALHSLLLCRPHAVCSKLRNSCGHVVWPVDRSPSFHVLPFAFCILPIAFVLLGIASDRRYAKSRKATVHRVGHQDRKRNGKDGEEEIERQKMWQTRVRGRMERFPYGNIPYIYLACSTHKIGWNILMCITYCNSRRCETVGRRKRWIGTRKHTVWQVATDQVSHWCSGLAQMRGCTFATVSLQPMAARCPPIRSWVHEVPAHCYWLL